MTTRILILGGGFAGMFAARELLRRLGRRAQIELINNENYFVFQPLLPEVGAGSITDLHAVSPLRFLLRGVSVRKARVDSVDFERQVATVYQGVQRRPIEVGWDHLVVALGQTVDLSRTPGLAEHALTMKTLEDARRLRAHVIERLEHANISAFAENKRDALTFCVIGAGFSGIETVGEMKDLIDRSVRYYPNISPAEVRVVVIEFADRVLGELPESLGRYAAANLERRGIEIQLGTGVASASGTTLVTTRGERIGTRTIVATIGNTPAAVVRKLDLELANGRVATERSLQARGRQNVWSLGDCALIPMKDDATERNDFAPPTAQFAVREAAHLARNLQASLDGRALQPFSYRSQGSLASLGGRRGVGRIWGVNISGWTAWMVWRAYYVVFLPGWGTRVRVLLNWILDGLSPRSVVQIRAHAPPSVRRAYYHAGDIVYEAGHRADGFYTVLSGAFEASGTDPETGIRSTRRVEAGGHFGERLILGDELRRSTVTALEDSRVLVLDRDEFVTLATAFVGFREYFEQYLSKTFGIDWKLN